MNTNRRDFLKRTVVAGGAVAAGVAPVALAGCAGGDAGGGGAEGAMADAGGTEPQQASRSLRILILGGTGFIGPHQVEYALSRGHEGHAVQPGGAPTRTSSPGWRSSSATARAT